MRSSLAVTESTSRSGRGQEGKQAGQASVQYLRFRQFFVLLATPGKHRFFIEEAGGIQDVRSVPIVVSGYSVSSREGRPHVRIAAK